MATHLDVPQPVDPVSVPALSGVFAPVADERDLSDLPVVGEVPPDLRGVYLRNGPNPLYPPLGSYTYPLDGDGMVHGIWIGDDGTIRYRNRWLAGDRAVLGVALRQRLRGRGGVFAAMPRGGLAMLPTELRAHVGVKTRPNSRGRTIRRAVVRPPGRRREVQRVSSLS
jgi:hypothetical protein